MLLFLLTRCTTRVIATFPLHDALPISRSRDQDDAGAPGIGGLRECVAHAAARWIGDDAHRVEVLPGGTRRDDDALPLPRRALQQEPLRRREDRLGLAHAAGTVA